MLGLSLPAKHCWYIFQTCAWWGSNCAPLSLWVEKLTTYFCTFWWRTHIPGYNWPQRIRHGGYLKLLVLSLVTKRTMAEMTWNELRQSWSNFIPRMKMPKNSPDLSVFFMIAPSELIFEICLPPFTITRVHAATLVIELWCNNTGSEAVYIAYPNEWRRLSFSCGWLLIFKPLIHFTQFLEESRRPVFQLQTS